MIEDKSVIRAIAEDLIWEEEEEDPAPPTPPTPPTPPAPPVGEGDPAPNPADLDDVFDPEEDSEPLGQKGVKALKEERNKRKRLEQQLKQYKDIDLTEYNRLQEEQAKTEKQRLKDQQQWQQLSKKQSGEITSLKTEIEKRQEAIKQLTKENELKDYYYAASGLQGRSTVDGRSYFDHVKDAIAKRTRREANGTYTVLDTEGFEQKNDSGGAMQVSELLEELRADKFYSHYFAAKTVGGGGMQPTGRNGRPSEGMTAKERWELLKRKSGFKEGSRL